MRELSSLLYTTIKNSSVFQTETGASSSDPRIYRTRTPVKHKIDNTSKGYAVYYRSGSILQSNIDQDDKNEFMYILEVYHKTDTSVEDICSEIERLFNNSEFETTNYVVKLSKAFSGSVTWDEGRSLYFSTVNVHFKKVISK